MVDIDSLKTLAGELLETDDVSSVGLRCLCCGGQTNFIEGDIVKFLSSNYNSPCSCGKGNLSFLVANFDSHVNE